jgi:hypothetical protein
MATSTDSQEKASALAAHCDQQLKLQGASLGPEYFYQSLPLCVIDAVYSIGVRYGGVRNVVKRYCAYFDLQELRNPREQIPPLDKQESLLAFLEKMNRLGIAKFTEDIFNSRQRTSTRNGILKSEAVRRFATVLADGGIHFLQDVPPRIADVNLEGALRQIPGQASGISISYFFMLAGSEDFIKPDRWIKGFLKHYLGYEPNPAEAQSLIPGACEMLRKTQYPHLTPRLLDDVIWNHERERQRRREIPRRCARSG